MNILDAVFQVLSVAVTAGLFAGVAYFTRAGWRRIIGALVAAAPLVPLVMFYDAVAAQMGWWRYPAVGAGAAPLAWYVASALGYGAAFGLVGWRTIRRWGSRGLLGFLAAFALFGAGRDLAYSHAYQLIVFGPGPLPILADLFAYASAAALVQLLMRWIAGPARADRLAREKQPGAS